MVVQMLGHRNSDLDERLKAALDLTEDFVVNHAQGVDDAFMARLKTVCLQWRRPMYRQICGNTSKTRVTSSS
jgi:hypothetical protein